MLKKGYYRSSVHNISLAHGENDGGSYITFYPVEYHSQLPQTISIIITELEMDQGSRMKGGIPKHIGMIATGQCVDASVPLIDIDYQILTSTCHFIKNVSYVQGVHSVQGGYLGGRMKYDIELLLCDSQGFANMNFSVTDSIEPKLITKITDIIFEI